MTRSLAYLMVGLVLGACASGDPLRPDAPAPADGDVRPPVPLPAVPLRTSGRWILDAHGDRFKLAAVSWYGAEELDYVVAGLDVAPRRAIAARIRELGFNAVRLPFSNELIELDPVVADAAVAANPDLAGKHALEVLDAVIDALADEGLVVILDDHVSAAGWCCSDDDGNGLWHTTRYPEATWLAHWRAMATRYLGQPAVVAMDLRNEPRPANGVAPTWGTGDPATDWRAAATRAGDAIHAINPDLLIVVQGLNYGVDLTGPYTQPLTLARADRVVYSPHDYAWFHTGLTSAEELHTQLGNTWGYLLTQGQAYTAPVWVGEFGTCNDSAACLDGASGDGLWFAAFRAYLANADIDWAYWTINGTQARAPSRSAGAPDTYGVLDPSWLAPAAPAHLATLQALQPITQTP